MTMATTHNRLRSNIPKLAVYSHSGDLSFLPPSCPGSPSLPTHGLKILGAFASCDQDWVADQLTAHVPKQLYNLGGLVYMHDTEMREGY